MEISAAVVRKPGGGAQIERVTLADPTDDEILVEIAGVGVCHTDTMFRDGSWPYPMPAVFGHEGAGLVVEVGSAVTGLVAGDHVVLSSASCGHCRSCRSALPNECDDQPLLNMAGARPDGSATMHQGDEIIHGNFVAQSSFASHALTKARYAVKVPDDLPLALCGTLGCGVQTGAGAIMNVLRPRAGQSVAIFGLGAVGLAAIAAAKASGCGSIVAVDVNRARFELARIFGATHTVDGSSGDAVARVHDLSNGGVDGAVEASGAPRALREAFESTHHSGTTVLVGVPPLGTEYALDAFSLVLGRSLSGSVMGRSNPPVFIPELVGLYRRGLLPLEAMSRTYALADIERAFADAHSGAVVKPVLIPG